MPVTHDFVTIDSCEDPSTWIPSADASTPSVNNSEYWEGSGSLDIGKSGTTSTVFYYERVFSTPINISGKATYIQLFIADRDTLNKLSNVAVYIEDVNGNWSRWYVKNGLMYGSVYYSKPLNVGWNVVRLFTWISYGYVVPTPNEKSSTNPDLTNIAKYRIEFYVSDPSITISTGKLKIDFLRVGSYVKYYGGTSAKPLTESDIMNDTGMDFWGYGERSGGRVTFYVSLILTDYLNINRLEIDQVAFSGQTDGYSDGYIQNSVIRLYGGSTWWQGAFFTFKGKVNLVNNHYEAYLPESARGGVQINTPNVSGISFFAPTGNLNLAVDKVSNIAVSGAGGNTLIGLNVNNGKYYNVYLVNAGLWNGYFNRVTYVYGGALKNVVLNTGGYNGGRYYFYDVDGFLDMANSPANNYSYYYYSIKARIVDEAEYPIANATVEIYDEAGNLVGSTVTDSNGWMVDRIYVLRREYSKDSSGNIIDVWHKFRLVVTKGSTIYYSAWLEINARFEGTIKVYNTYKAIAYINKTPIQLNEPVVIYAEFSDWSNNPLTGLNVSATITKPDGSTVSITLTEYESGKYSAVFSGTDKVGTYIVEVSTTISGNVVKTRTSFDVGAIEKAIESAKNELLQNIQSAKNELAKQLKKLEISEDDKEIFMLIK